VLTSSSTVEVAPLLLLVACATSATSLPCQEGASVTATATACQEQVGTASCMAILADYPHLNQCSESCLTLVAQHCTLQIKYQHHCHFSLGLAPVCCSSVHTVHVHTPTTGGAKCDKCNIPVASGGCQCNSNCDCITSGEAGAGCLHIDCWRELCAQRHTCWTCMSSGAAPLKSILLPSVNRVKSASIAGTAWNLLKLDHLPSRVDCYWPCCMTEHSQI
jgi:hypothetical protein